MKRYETTLTAAKRWRTTPETLRERCARGRIEGARYVNEIWMVPID